MVEVVPRPAVLCLRVHTGGSPGPGGLEEGGEQVVVVPRLSVLCLRVHTCGSPGPGGLEEGGTGRGGSPACGALFVGKKSLQHRVFPGGLPSKY